MQALVLKQPGETARSLGVPVAESFVHEAVVRLGAELLPAAPTGRLVIAHELEFAYGRPDLIAADVNLSVWRSWSRKRIQPCTAPVPLGVADALARLDGSATLDTLVRSMAPGFGRRRVVHGLAVLKTQGRIARKGETHVLRLLPGNAVQSASGVEAKLNNWRRAVRQVQSWEGLVDAVWLAFPNSYLSNVPRSLPLRRFGLIGADDYIARVIRRPRGSLTRGVKHLLVEQHLYRRWLTIGTGSTNLL